MGHLKNNYHTHNRLCNHAQGGALDYVKKAVSLGMEEIGLSDHGPIPCRFMSHDEFISNLCYRNMSLDEFYNIYLPEVNEAKLKYQGDIKVLKALEVEYIPGEEEFYASLKEHLDYLNLGVHYFKDSKGNIINSYSQINYTNVLEYAKTACMGMRSGLFRTLVHPDLFMFEYKNIKGERRFDEAAIEASKMILDCAKETGTYLEVNVNGLSNSLKYHSDEWLYPYDEFWSLASKHKDLHIIIGVDAHNPEALDSEAIDMVKEFTKRMGLMIEDKMGL